MSRRFRLLIVVVLPFLMGQFCGGPAPTPDTSADDDQSHVQDGSSTQDPGQPDTSTPPADDQGSDHPPADEQQTDDDTTPAPVDLCPDDPDKTGPGLCGCGFPDTDTDSDGTPDCNDLCPYDENKIEPGICGCGIPDWDLDGDLWPDLCLDNCPFTYNPDQIDSNQNGLGDACDVYVPMGTTLWAQDGTFLGNVNSNAFDSNSLANSFGTYGNRFNPLSIWNSFGLYGSTFGLYSPWNTMTTTPPIIYQDGVAIMYVTANSFITPRIHPNELALLMGRTDVLR